MWVVKKKEGSVNYIVSWAIMALLLAVGLFCIILALRYFVAHETSFLVTGPNIATVLLALGAILLPISIFLFSRQVHLLARLTKLEQVMDNVRSGMRLAESMGIDIKRVEDPYRVAESKVGFVKLKETENIMADCSATLESLLTLHTDKLLERTRADIERKRDLIGIEFSEDSLQPIREELEKGNYWNVSRLLRGHRIAADRLEELWVSIRKAVRLGLQVGDERAKLVSALEKFNEGNTSAARIESVRARDILTGRMRDFVKENYVAPVYQKIATMTSKGIPSEEAQRLITNAGTHLLAVNLEDSMKMASLSDDRISNAAIGGIEDSLDKVDSICDRAEQIGLDVSVPLSQIETAKEELGEGKLEESLDQIRQVGLSLVQDMNSFVLDRFHSLKKDIDLLFLVPEAKLEFVAAIEKADEERKTGNYEGALELAHELSEKVRDESKESHRVYESSTEKLEEKIGELKKKGIPTDAMEESISVSGQLVSDENYASAMEIILSATETANRNLALHKDSIRTLEEVSTLLKRAKEKGVDIGDFSERLADLKDSADLEGVIVSAKQVEEEALQRTTDLTERTNIELLTMRDQLGKLLQDGIDVGAVPDLLEIAEQELEKEDFTAAQKTIDRISADLEQGIALSESFDEVLSQFKEALVLLEKAGVATSLFESDLQNIVTRKDEASLEEVYNLLDELKAEKKRIKKQAKETVKESRDLMEEHPDIAFEEEMETIENAAKAYEEERYGQAFEIAVEAVGRTQKKVELFQRSAQLLEKVGSDLEKLADAGFDAHALESELQLSEMEKDPGVRIEKIRAVESEVVKAKTRLTQSMEWAIVEARHGITLLEKNGVSSEDLAEMLESAEGLASEHVYREAQKKARNVRDLADERVGQFREAEAKMKSLETIMTSADEIGVSVEEFEEDLSWLKSSDDYSHIIEKAGLMYDGVNNLLEDKREDVRSLMSSIRDSLVELEKTSVFAPAVADILEKAELELSEDSIVASLESCSAAEERLEEVKISHEKWMDVQSSVKRSLEEAGKSGIGIKDFETRLEDLKASTDYDSASSEADRILDDLDSRKTVMSTRTLEDIQETKDKLSSLMEEGMQGEPLLDLLKEAERFVQEENYLSARQKWLEVTKALDGLKGSHAEFMAILNEERAKVEKIAESGLDASDVLEKLEGLKDSEEEYDTRIQMARELGESALRMRESLGEEASAVLSEAREILGRMKSEGAEIEHAQSILSHAEEKFSDGNLSEARRLALEAKTSAEEVVSLDKEREVQTARAKAAVENAAIWGVDVSVLTTMLEDANSLEDDVEALQELHAVIEGADNARLSLSEGVNEKLDSLKGDIQRLRDDGIRVSSLEALLESAEQAVGKGESAEARERIEALEVQKSKLEEMHSDYLEVKKEVEEDITGLEAGQEELEPLLEEKRKAEAAEDYEEAIQIMLDLSGKIIRLRREMKDSAENQLRVVREFVNGIGDEGANVEDALSLLYEAEEVLNEGGYLRAIAKVNRAGEMGQKISFENRYSEIEKLLKTVNEEGIAIDDLMDRLKSLRGGTDYDQMTETLESIKKETNKRRGTY